jgi:hypothetical protein
MDHQALNEELQADIDAYANGGQRSFPISDKLATSVARWPAVTEELVVYRGQPKEFSQLPMMTRYDKRPFFSATYGLDIAKRFAGQGGLIFKITLKPGVRFLRLTHTNEAEVFVAADGLAEYGTTKVRVTNPDDRKSWAMAWPVTLSPTPTGGRRRRQLSSSTRYTRRKIKHKLASWNPRIHTQRAMESSIRPTEKPSRGRRSGGGPGGSRDPSCS